MCADLLKEKFNQIISRERPNPTASLFWLTRRIIDLYESGDYYCEVGRFRANLMKKYLNLMIRWPVSPQEVLGDTYYGNGELAKIIYDSHFTESLLEKASMFADLLKTPYYSGYYVGKNGKVLYSPENIVKKLTAPGFIGADSSSEQQRQHVWTIPNDRWNVRIKEDGEMTIGYNFIPSIEFYTNNENPYYYAVKRSVQV